MTVAAFDTPELVSRLHHVRLQVTSARLAVLQTLRRARHHLPAEFGGDAVGPQLWSVSTQASYNTLHTLPE